MGVAARHHPLRGMRRAASLVDAESSEAWLETLTERMAALLALRPLAKQADRLGELEKAE